MENGQVKYRQHPLAIFSKLYLKSFPAWLFSTMWILKMKVSIFLKFFLSSSFLHSTMHNLWNNGVYICSIHHLISLQLRILLFEVIELHAVYDWWAMVPNNRYNHATSWSFSSINLRSTNSWSLDQACETLIRRHTIKCGSGICAVLC